MDDETQAAPATDAVVDTSPAAATPTGGKSEIAGQLRDALDGKPSDLDSSPHETLRKSIADELSKTTETPDAKPGERARGPDGKFIARDGLDPEPNEPVPEPQPVVPEVGQPPAGWKTDSKAKWAEVPDWARDEITRGEERLTNLSAKYQGWKPIEPVLEWVGQVAPGYGLNTPQVVQSWANTQAALMRPETASSEIVKLARQYLKPDAIQALAQQVLGSPAAPQGTQPAQPADPNAWVDPELAQVKQELAQFKNWKTELETQAQQAARQESQRQHGEKVSAIDKFSAEKGPDGQPLRPHLGTVMPDMVASIQKIRSTNPQLSDQDVLQQAYDAAVWGNPETRKLVLDAQKVAEDAERKAEARKRAQAASRSAVSPASTSPQGPPAQTAPKGNLRDQMRQTFESLTA